MITIIDKLSDSTNYIKKYFEESIEIGLILGSGLGDFADSLENKISIPFSDIPHIAKSTVQGHKGQFIIGKLFGKKIIAMQGRLHLYEGHKSSDVVYPIYLMKELGINSLVITNACGGLNPEFKPGDLMLINDHINCTGSNPLVGQDFHNNRFPDMTYVYDKFLINQALGVARKQNTILHQGVYAGIKGPSYMTPSELNALGIFGADTVGMSTVLEAIAASHLRLRVLGISCITDMAISENLEPLTHEQVLNVANKAGNKLKNLITEIIKESSF